MGRAASLERGVPATVPRYHLPDALVTPGFVDGHTHFAMWALARQRVQLAGAASRAEAVRRVHGATQTQGWVLGQGWDANNWELPPDRWCLDQVQAGPVYLDSLDVHAAWLNSAALRAAQITRDTPDPPGGRIVRDGNGDPMGVLLERAVQLVRPFLPVPSHGSLAAAMLEAQTEAHRLGVTGIHDVEGWDVFHAFRSLETRGELRLRVLFHPPVERLPELIRDGIRSGTGSRLVLIGGVKMFLDGSLGSRTAWMLEPYEGTSDRGMVTTSEAEARRAVQRAASHGIASTVHAIGDAAVRRALDLLIPLPRLVLPHRIEHFQCVAEADLERAARSGIVLSMQPAHLLTDIPLVDRYWGRRGRGAYLFKSLLRRGAPVVFGSDVPVATIDPRPGAFAAMERRESAQSGRGWYPEERLSLEEVVHAYTSAPARAGGAGERQGRLAPGYDADLVAWNVDPGVERGDGEAFLTARAVLTVVSGEVVMRA